MFLNTIGASIKIEVWQMRTSLGEEIHDGGKTRDVTSIEGDENRDEGMAEDDSAGS